MNRPWTAETVAASRPAAHEPLTRLLWDAGRALAGDDPVAQRHLLLLRFALVNILAFGLVGAAAGQGWIDQLLAAEGSSYSIAIVLVFAAGLILSGHRASQLSQALNEVKRFELDGALPAPAYLRAAARADGQSRALLASTLKLKLVARIAPVKHIANSLVLLGLIGTVIGFIIALAGVDPEAAADVSSIGPMVSTLIDGMSVALHTTLVGSVLNVWLMVNYRLVESGTVRLLTAIVELGERRG